MRERCKQKGASLGKRGCLGSLRAGGWKSRQGRAGEKIDFFSALLDQTRLRNNTDSGGSVTSNEWGRP